MNLGTYCIICIMAVKIFTVELQIWLIVCHDLKCYYDQIFDFHFFTFSWTIRLSYSPCTIYIYYEHQKSFYYNIYSIEFTAAIN